MTRPPGRLVLVATPIGNLGDLSPAMTRALAEADLVLAEDTRRARILLEHAGVRARPVRFDDRVERQRAADFAARISEGETAALISDAGTPTISDPGFRLVRACHEAGVPVTAVPGPCAAVVALSVSGLPTDRFHFGGYPPRRSAARRRFFRELSELPATLLFYESPMRIVSCLEDAVAVFESRDAVVTRELTKLHEELVRGPLPKVLEELAGRDRIRGEIVVVIDGAARRRGRSPVPDPEGALTAPQPQRYHRKR